MRLSDGRRYSTALCHIGYVANGRNDHQKVAPLFTISDHKNSDHKVLLLSLGINLFSPKTFFILELIILPFLISFRFR